eukprot:6173318-Pleurochrysis_carterae.AAC.2
MLDTELEAKGRSSHDLFNLSATRPSMFADALILLLSEGASLVTLVGCCSALVWPAMRAQSRTAPLALPGCALGRQPSRQKRCRAQRPCRNIFTFVDFTW